ncbi:hypothetical protein N6H18_10780 [Reichenbachiella agarivorans]|uniref:6-phosphogluconate dehydrogenase NADP-binding domain-containing protein n=1 Tax=Reichenbachiella agarivorans TaxID=2979464 RepID=A0ABY6CK24_9BACT|nr:NAD(P)-binding domain-containing protein [Reichenbachiella agarivorans]UXP30837.1 hypothetical protein N6H18_10780 [Reichenbachiella agarivorans]
MKQISIMGCGWLGMPLAIDLIKKGYQVKGSTSTPTKLKTLEDEGIEPYLSEKGQKTIDSSDFFDNEIFMINIPPRNTPEDPNFHLDQLQAIANQIDFDKTKVLFISSTAVYPSPNAEVTEADASYDCYSRGGVSLLKAEEIFSKEKNTTVLRMAGLYGPERHPAVTLSGKKIGGKDSPVNMIHLDDCIGVIETILEQELWGETFNVCSPNHPTKEEFYKKSSKKLKIAPPTYSDIAIDYKIVNSDKLKAATKYKFKH